MKTTRLMLGLCMLAALSGCSNSYSSSSYCTGCLDKCSTNMRNRWLAHLAWKDWCWAYGDLPHCGDFASGFKAGYCNVCEGKPGCQPTHPPKRYWNVAYQNAEGHCRVNSWFDGYTHGALAAQQDGFAGASMIPVSPTYSQNMARAAYEREIRYQADRERMLKLRADHMDGFADRDQEYPGESYRGPDPGAAGDYGDDTEPGPDDERPYEDLPNPLEGISPLDDAAPQEDSSPLDESSTMIPGTGVNPGQNQAGFSTYNTITR